MIHYFNPGHEMAVLNKSPYYMPPANVLRMQHDLSYLPAWYASTDEFVFINEEQADEVNAFIDVQNRLFVDLPQIITHNNIATVADSEICLWGIAPQAIHLFETINQDCDMRLKIPAWHDEYLYLTGRLTAKNCLESLIQHIPAISADLLPHFCDNLDEVEEIIKKSKYPMLAKAPYSSSGKGIIWLTDSFLDIKEKELLSGIIKKQRSISLEFVLNKKLDFSMQFLCDGRGEARFEGLSLFETNTKGAYSGNFLYSQEKITNLLTEKISSTLLDNVKTELLSILKSTYASVYKGCIGVDMMVYEKDKNLYLHPCVEINMRYNMGYLALKLHQNRIHPTSEGKFFIEYTNTGKITSQKHLEAQQHFPLQLKNGAIQKGYLSLCPVSEQSKYRAYIVVSEMG